MITNKAPKDCVYNFPVSCSQIYLTKDNITVRSFSYVKGKENKTIIVTDWRYKDNNYPYLVKIKNKFPDWKFENPYTLDVQFEQVDINI